MVRVIIIFVRDSFSRYSWTQFLKKKPGIAKAFREFLTDVCEVCIPEALLARTANGGELIRESLEMVCVEHRIKQGFTTAKSPGFNGGTDRALGIILSSVSAARIKSDCFFRRRQQS